jgi:putative ABC transport system ATP-binding protein
MNMIVIKDLRKHYDYGLVRALNGVSFEVAEGEAVSIMGPSGCGKTTLLNLIGALDVPTEGEILVEGRNIHKDVSPDLFRATTVGFVFQFHHLIPNLTLLENVEIPMYTLKTPKGSRRQKAAAILKEMGLGERMNFLPTRVSGGERQRAAIARAMINDPRIILADEPTGSVDTSTGGRILELLLELCESRKLTMLISTHNREVAAGTSRIIHLKNGVIEA